MVVTDPSVGVVAASEAGALIPEAGAGPDILFPPSLHPPPPNDPKTTHKCPICAKGFDAKWNRRRHLESVHFKNKSECPRCKNPFSSPSALKAHQQKTSACADKSVRVRCETCDIELRGDLNRHRTSDKHQHRLQTQRLHEDTEK